MTDTARAASDKLVREVLDFSDELFDLREVSVRSLLSIAYFVVTDDNYKSLSSTHPFGVACQKLLVLNESVTPPSSTPYKRRKLHKDGARDRENVNNNDDDGRERERDWEEELREHTGHASSLESRYAKKLNNNPHFV